MIFRASRAARLLIAAHGTTSATGSATTLAIADAVAAARPSLAVSLCFLDVRSPSLTEALAASDGPVVVVPLLLAAGYHVLTDIPDVVAGRPDVIVTPHLGPDPLVVAAVHDRLLTARGALVPRSSVLAAIGSSQPSARADVDRAAAGLSELVGRPVPVVPVAGDVRSVLSALPGPVEVAVYLLAEGVFLRTLQVAVRGLGVAAAPLGAHPAVVSAILARYDGAELA